MSRPNSLALEALSQDMPTALHVVEAPDMEAPLDPFEHNVLLLPGDVTIADREEKRARNLARTEVCKTIRLEYASKPEVMRAVARYELPREKRREVSKDSKLYKLEIDANKYRMLEKTEVYPLFMAMERGVETFVRLGYTTANANEKDVQAFIDHATAHSILYHTNQRLALNTARKRYGPRFNKSPYFEDIAVDATDAIFRALQLFNYRKGLALSTFVVTAIHTQTDRYIANHIRTVRVPTNVDEEHKKVLRKTRELTAKLKREPTSEEVAAATNHTQEKINKLHQDGRYDLTSLDAVVGDKTTGTHTTRGELLPDPRETDAHQKNVEEKELASTLDKAIENAKLSPAEMITISLRSGYRIGAIEDVAPSVPIDDLLEQADASNDGLSYRRIAHALLSAELIDDTSTRRVKAIEEDALNKLSKFKKLQALSLAAALAN